MIKNIVFDMGRVLIEWEPEVIVAREGLGEDDSRLLLREVFACGEWVLFDPHAFVPQRQ